MHQNNILLGTVTPKIMGALNANCSNVVKDADFRFDRHTSSDSPVAFPSPPPLTSSPAPSLVPLPHSRTFPFSPAPSLLPYHFCSPLALTLSFVPSHFAGPRVYEKLTKSPILHDNYPKKYFSRFFGRRGVSAVLPPLPVSYAHRRLGDRIERFRKTT